MTKLTLAVALVFLLGTALHAEDSYPGDEVFVNQMARDSLFEFKAGKLAITHAASGDVKDFGALMVLDFAKINDQLQLMARSKAWRLPTTLNTSQDASIDEFSEVFGHDFDRKYSAKMLQTHDQYRARIHSAAKYAADADVRAWAQKTEPSINSQFDQVPRPLRVQTTTTIIKEVRPAGE